MLLRGPLAYLAFVVGLVGCDTVFGLSGGSHDASVDAEIDGPPIDAPPDAPPILPYDVEVLQDMPLAYWKLDETTGTTAKNEIAGSPDGMYLGDFALGADASITSQPGTAVSLGPAMGASSSIDFGNNFQFSGLVPFSVEAWVKLEGTSTGTPIVLGKRNDATDGSGWILYFSNELVIFRRHSSEVSASFAFYSDQGDLKRWRHIVATFDGAITNIYVDGATGSSDASAQVIPAGTANLVAGTIAPGNTGNVLRGRMDNIALYGKALTKVRIAAHFGASQ